jgi:hypothetical protein
MPSRSSRPARCACTGSPVSPSASKLDTGGPKVLCARCGVLHPTKLPCRSRGPPRGKTTTRRADCADRNSRASRIAGTAPRGPPAELARGPPWLDAGCMGPSADEGRGTRQPIPSETRTLEPQPGEPRRAASPAPGSSGAQNLSQPLEHGAHSTNRREISTIPANKLLLPPNVRAARSPGGDSPTRSRRLEARL